MYLCVCVLLRRYAAWCEEASPSEVASVWATGSSRLTDRAWWPLHTRRLSRPCPTLSERLNTHTQTRAHTLFFWVHIKPRDNPRDENSSCFLSARSTWKPCRLPCSDSSQDRRRPCTYNQRPRQSGRLWLVCFCGGGEGLTSLTGRMTFSDFTFVSSRWI